MVLLLACVHLPARADSHSLGLILFLPNTFLMFLEFFLGSCTFVPKSNNLFILVPPHLHDILKCLLRKWPNCVAQ